MARIQLELDSGRTLNLEVRALFLPGLLLHRSTGLRVGEIQVGQERTAIGLIHCSSGVDFDDVNQLKVLVDRNGDGRFNGDEAVRTSMPIQFGDKYVVLKSATADGKQAEFAWFESDHSLAIDFLIPDADFLTLEGEKFRPSSSRGKWRVINIWATFC